MHNLQNLLNQVGIIVKKNNEILDATGGRFNVFNVIGLASDEVRLHSALLAELLRPNGTHGLKDEFLKEFIKQLNIENFDCQSAKIEVEKSIGSVTDTDGGRIDIVLSDKNGYAIIIENKIYAGDQKYQLIRYDSYAKTRHAGKYTILYLTLDGKEANENSAGKILYTPISYAIDILNWLETCLKLAVRQPLVRETISQYITLIKQLTNQDMNSLNKDELVNTIAATPENVLAAFSIIENISPLKDKIISDYFNVQLNEIANEFELKVFHLNGRKAEAYFLFSSANWDYFDIVFEFDGNELSELGYFYKLKDESKPAPEATINYLRPLFTEHNETKSIPCGFTFMHKYRRWDYNAYIAIVTGEMKTEIRSIILNLLEISRNLEM